MDLHQRSITVLNKDLTNGKPQTVLWQFCLPLFGSIIFQQLYNIADSLVAGKFIGENALAAVGNSYEITLIFIAFAFGCNIGCSVIVSMFFGAKRFREMKTAVSTSMITSGVICAVLMLIGGLFCGRLLQMIHTPDVLFADSALYLRIYIWGLPFVFFYNISNGIFSALGDSRTPFLFLAASSCSNIAMDIWFVAGFHMGVAGVAWATFLCQGVSCILALIFVLRRLGTVEAEGRAQLFSWDICGRFAKVAVPSILQQSFISIGNIVIQGVINGFGPGVMAGYSAAIKLNNLVITSFTTLANGVSNYTAQNLGAGKLPRIREGFRAALKMVWILSAPIAALYFGFSRGMLLFFLSEPSKDAMHSGVMLLRILAPFYFVISTKLVADGVLRGSSMMREFMAATFTDLILRVVLAIVLSRTVLGYVGIWCAWPVGWSIAAVLSLRFYMNGPWKSESGTPAADTEA